MSEVRPFGVGSEGVPAVSRFPVLEASRLPTDAPPLKRGALGGFAERFRKKLRPANSMKLQQAMETTLPVISNIPRTAVTLSCAKSPESFFQTLLL